MDLDRQSRLNKQHINGSGSPTPCLFACSMLLSSLHGADTRGAGGDCSGGALQTLKAGLCHSCIYWSTKRIPHLCTLLPPTPWLRRYSGCSMQRSWARTLAARGFPMPAQAPEHTQLPHPHHSPVMTTLACSEAGPQARLLWSRNTGGPTAVGSRASSCPCGQGNTA